MSEARTGTTELTTQYAAKVAADLDRNAKEQKRVGAEMAALQEQLRALQHDRALLVRIQRTLGSGSTAEPTRRETDTGERASPGDTPADATPAAPKKAAATQQKAEKAAARTTARAAARPTLVELVRDHLGRQTEPRSAAEIAAVLAQAHPNRPIKTTVVRTTAEGLVAKGLAERTKQGASVFYMATPDTSAPQGRQQD